METQSLISIDLIDHNPYQPRQVEDAAAIAEIAASIRQNGLMQVPSARQVNGRYQLAFGHTRLSAYKFNGEECMPLIIRDLTDLQMFELGVAENIKRRDLNPIEQAEAMKRYMQEFDKNSIETGEFFGVSEEQVRGTVRLTNLVPAAQTALAAGKINITTARSLLSMQKIASEQVIIETVKKIEKRQGNEHPDETIEDVVRHQLKDVERMWDEHSGNGKPHSSYRGGWPLDMKRFPNNLLPALTPVDAAIALGIQDNEDMMEKVGDWVMATNLKDSELDPNSYALSIPDELLQKLEHLVNPPACNSCPFYTKIRGYHFCGVKLCHERKTSAWQLHLVEQASKKLDIAIYDKEVDGGYRVIDWQDQQLFTKKHKGLRLIAKDAIEGYTYQHFTGLDDDAVVVVATGTALEQMKSHRQSGNGGGKKTDKEKARMRAMKIYRPRRRELIWEFTLIGNAIFEAVPYSMLLKINHWQYMQQDLQPSKEVMVADNAKVDDAKIEYMRRLTIWKMAVENSWHEINNLTDFTVIVKRLEKLAQEWKVQMPTAIAQMAEQFQLEVDDIMGSVSAVTPKKANGKKGK